MDKGHSYFELLDALKEVPATAATFKVFAWEKWGTQVL